MTIKRIAIEITNKAFLPESYAYRNYFRKHGYICNFVEKGMPEIMSYDAIFLFHGFHPFWKSYPKYIIGEYHSLSTGKFNRLKDFLKRLINVRPNIYSFLNENVRKKMWFTKNINYITRGMGVDDIGLEKFIDQPKIFDVVYCGSNRTGLFNEIKRIADMGLTVALIGPSEQIEHRNITSFGRRLPSEVKELITQCRYGLNYTPDVFPFNIQDSTKVIEYSAYNLGVITNRYQWIDDFERERSANFMNLESLKTKKDLDLYPFVIPNVADLFWGDLIDRTGLVNKIRAL